MALFGFFGFDVHSTFADDHSELGLVIDLLGCGRNHNRITRAANCVVRLQEIDGRFRDVTSSFFRVLGVIAPDTDDLAGAENWRKQSNFVKR